MDAGSLVTWVKRVVLRAGIYRPGYPYKINPGQLAWLTESIERSRQNSIPGCIVEAGVAVGMTSFWLAHHMQLQRDLRYYIGIDTFNGFVPKDVKHEVNVRGKTQADYKAFGYNDARTFERNIKRSGYGHCMVYQCPIQQFAWERVPLVDVLLLDVDLYLPTLETLRRVRPRMNRHSFIMIDDCWPGTWADGSLQAYLEFCGELGVQPAAAGAKGGVIEFNDGKAVRSESALVMAPQFPLPY